MALTNKLSAIGDAIREKTGKTELLTLDAMPLEIASITTGGGEGIEVEPMVLTGNCQYACSGAMESNYIDMFGDTVSTDKIQSGQYMFYFNENKKIPFDLNFDADYYTRHRLNNMFYSASKLEELPKMNNVKVENIESIFTSCSSLKEIPMDYFDNWDWSYVKNATGAYSCYCQSIYQGCYNLRYAPNFTQTMINRAVSNYYCIYYYGYSNCYSIEDIKLPVYDLATWTSNAFQNTIYQTYSLRHLTFNTNENGSPIVCGALKQQTIDLTTSGYFPASVYVMSTDFKDANKILDDATYQTLKDNPDAWTEDINYSFYNRSSAVETINTLPDVSAGSNNTIRFKGAAGALTFSIFT